MANEISIVIERDPRAGFVQTTEVRRTVKQALRHIKAGHPVHIHGDDEFTTSDFIACLRSELQDDSRGLEVELAAGKGIWADLVGKREHDDE